MLNTRKPKQILIKICGIQTPALAKLTALAGANFIGIVFHDQSRRNTNLDQAKIISLTIKENGAIPVAIFVNQTAQEMHKICLITDIQLIQLHGNIARQQHQHLSPDYQRLYVRPVLPNGVIKQDHDNGLRHCDPTRDYLLFDNIHAGKGLPFNWETFNYQGPFRIGVAGGLNAHNVMIAIHQCQPVIVDVSSGVENNGEKQITLIKDFIHAVHACRRGINDAPSYNK